MLSKNISSLFIIIIFLIVGCKKFVEIPPPSTQVVAASAFTDNATAIAIQLAIYAQINAHILPYSLKYFTGLSADELTPYTTGTPADLYANNLTAATDGGIAVWFYPYNFIYQENALIQNLLTSNSVSAQVKKQLIAEATFIRAYMYFYLVNLYGDVPLVTSPNYTANSSLPRADKGVVYNQIITDLKTAIDSLSSNYLDATDTVITVDRVRPTTWAAKALLSRVYLYTGVWKSADSLASQVIENTAAFSLVPLDQVFLKNSMEAIWEIMPTSTQSYASEGYYFGLVSSPSFNQSTLDSQLVNAFEPGDGRRAVWVGTLTKGATTYYYANKYRTNKLSTGTTKEYSMILRLAEQYLIRAEAKAMENDLGAAIADINAIRSRATGIPPLSNNLTQAGVLAAIAHERRVELFTEADRWLDLKRTNKIDSVMTIVTPQKKGIPWQSYQQLFPLSVTDLQADYKLTQNSGY